MNDGDIQTEMRSWTVDELAANTALTLEILMHLDRCKPPAGTEQRAVVEIDASMLRMAIHALAEFLASESERRIAARKSEVTRPTTRRWDAN